MGSAVSTFNDVLIAYAPVALCVVTGLIAIVQKNHSKKIRHNSSEIKRLREKVNGDGFDEGNDYAV